MFDKNALYISIIIYLVYVLYSLLQTQFLFADKQKKLKYLVQVKIKINLYFILLYYL